ncbi:MAG: glycosyltransferase family 4 protein [Solirubrobacteraceae bacterium]
MHRICVIRLAYFPFDPRMSRDVFALAGAGHRVHVICLRDAGQRRLERTGSITVWRLPMRHRRAGLLRWIYEYTVFTLMAGVLAGLLNLPRRLDLVQVHTLPDTLVFAAAIPKLLGVSVLLDLHECLPEFFAASFEVAPTHPVVRLTAAAEQSAIRFADFALTCTAEMREVFVGRGARAEKIAIVMNSNDESVFDPSGRPAPAGEKGGFTLIHHGSMESRYGIDTVIRAVAALRPDHPGLRLALYGDGSQRAELTTLVADLGLDDAVSFSPGFVPIDELVDAIGAADAGVVAMRRDPFRDLTHCMKMFDLISMRTPVLCSRTRSVMNYFPPACFAYFEPDDPADLARAVAELIAHPERSQELVAAAARVNEPYRWPRQRERYLRIVASLAGPQGPSSDAALRELSQAPN